MSEVLLFHHALGLTSGVLKFADDLRQAGHKVHTPDLFEGNTFNSIEKGLAFIEETGFDEMRERGVRMADDLPHDLVYAGFSFGVLPAQKLAQTRPGARAALLIHSCLPISGDWSFGPCLTASLFKSTQWTMILFSSAKVTSSCARDR